MEPTGPLIAQGRDCDVFDHGERRVFRRSREGRSQELEARAMEYVRAAGYPVPAVEWCDGADLVMERVEGRPLLDVVATRPWRAAWAGEVLADLHDRLHDISAPDWLRAVPDGGDRVIHLDLHPLNVLMTAAGPVVIDWSNAARGGWATDVGYSWLIMATSVIPGNLVQRSLGGVFRDRLVRSFIGRYDRQALVAELPRLAEERKQDRHLLPAEFGRIDRFVASGGGRT